MSFLDANCVIRKEIDDVEAEWRHASAVNNIERFTNLIADNFIGVLMDGAVVNRLSFLQCILDGHRRMKSVVVSNKFIEIQGSVAVVVCDQMVEAEFNGVPFNGAARATRVWVKIASVWKLMSFHTSDIRKLSKWDDLKKR
jgi:ketosteroid isomerase-like protein